MPFIHIKSLPFEKPVAIKAVPEGISEDFSHETGIALEHVTATWEFSCLVRCYVDFVVLPPCGALLQPRIYWLRQRPTRGRDYKN
jgi:hypothetical protein